MRFSKEEFVSEYSKGRGEDGIQFAEALYSVIEREYQAGFEDGVKSVEGKTA